MRKVHGTRAAYTRGCRCKKCRKANSAYMSQYRRGQSKPTAWRNYRGWEPWEDELAVDYTLTAWEVADMLERTPAAVSSRRRVLMAQCTNQKEAEQ